MGTGITDVIGEPHDFLTPRSDRSDEFQNLPKEMIIQCTLCTCACKSQFNKRYMYLQLI